MSHSIEVLINRSETYPICVGMDIWDEVYRFFAAHYPDRKIFIVIDARVNHLHGDRIEKECRRYFKSCHFIEIPEGEQSKSIDRWTRIQNKLLGNGVERSTPLLAVGGGVTGDLAGFSAASILRGIPLIHMPTSLLAMVDSSIGGKTGVNHQVGKNMIGSFYQPDAVYADINFLETLDRSEWISGMAEILKYAAIQSPAMFEELEKAVGEGFKPSQRWLKLIRQSAAVKADIVQQDVHESGKRYWLNFGHTFGHALEKLSGFGNMSHGEAVYVGMIAALFYSKACDAPVDEARFSPFHSLYKMNLPDKNRIPDLIDAMQYDKKVKDEKIHLVLLNNWGDPVIRECRDESLLEDAWQKAYEIFNT